MSEREPSLLRDQAEGPESVHDAVTAATPAPAPEQPAPDAPAPDVTTEPTPAPAAEIVTEPTEAPVAAAVAAPAARPSRREASTVYVVGFWKRLAAAAIDLAIVIPAALLITLIASKLAGVPLPPSNIRLLDVDMWIDLVLAADGAVVMAIVLTLAIGMTYLLVFQILVGRTLGMRVLKIKIIDVYGDKPSPARCLARCGGYLASVATLFLGFLWMGVDSEKRGLQDWIAGTYVIRA
jgi:uncharacterized RDD family membrane protein YckC